MEGNLRVPFFFQKWRENTPANAPKENYHTKPSRLLIVSSRQKLKTGKRLGGALGYPYLAMDVLQSNCLLIHKNEKIEAGPIPGVGRARHFTDRGTNLGRVAKIHPRNC